MKNVYLFVVCIVCSLVSRGQCFPGYIVGPTTVGMGHSLSLSDSANWVYDGTWSYGVAGTWTSSNPSIATVNPATGVVSGVSMGNVTITFSMPAPCGMVATRTMNVNSGATGRRFICLGDTTTYSNSIGAGTWSSSNPAVATVNPVSGLVTGISAGLTILSYNTTISGVPTILTDTLNVADLSAFNITSASSHVCVDANDSLFSPTPVWWQILDTGRLRYNRANNYTLVVTGGPDSNSARVVATSLNCPLVKDTITISVLPLPNAGEVEVTPYSACYTEPIYATNTGGLPGTWSLNSVWASISTDGVITAGAWDETFGVYYTVVGSNGCVNVTMNVAEFRPGTYLWDVEGPLSIPIGTTATYFAPSYSLSPILATEWTSSESTIGGISSSGVLTGLSAGITSIVYHATNECGTETIGQDITITPPAIGGSCSTFTAYTNDNCSGPVFGVSIPPHASAYQLRTYFGDGTPAVITAIPSSSDAALTSFPHTYTTSGVYSIKQVLYNGVTAIDSVTYDYEHLYCSDLALSFFFDNNGNCLYDTASDNINVAPFMVEVLRNGVVRDTIPVTSGMYYPAVYLPGDVYAFRPLNSVLSFVSSCSAGGVVYDTASASGWTFNSKDVAIVCGSAAFDLSVSTSQRCGRHMARGSLIVSNYGCVSAAPSIVMQIDTSYRLVSSYPAPTSVVGNTVTWNLPILSLTESALINYTLDLPTPTSTWLMPGREITTTYSVSPISGDADTSNNRVVRVDTVKSSYDPNHMSVLPAGGILNGTKLHYTIQFENDGNDTAHNIFILDTLSDNLIASTMEIEGASAFMNTTILHSSGHTIVRFEFPNIMLPDSSHHDLCRGMVTYTINSRTGLPDGTDILGHAGIYFDDNEVILTDTAYNHIVVPALSIVASADSICGPASVHFTAAPHSINTPHFAWYVNSVLFGTDSVGAMLVAAHANDTVRCEMTTIQDDTVFSVSNSIVVREAVLPYAGAITGLSSVCTGADITLSNPVAGGVWTVAATHATITGGVVHGVSAGADTAIYTVTNACFSSSVIHAVAVDPLPDAGSIGTVAALCEGASVTVTATTSGGTWSLVNMHASVSGSVVTAVSAGVDTLIYSVANTCGIDSAITAITISPTLIPSVTTAFTPTGSLCEGATVTFTATPANGGLSPVYHWKKFGAIIGSGATLTYSPAVGDVITCTMLSSEQCISSDSVTSAGTTLSVSPLVTPSTVIATVTGDSVSYIGEMVTLNSTTTYCGASATYTWYVNGLAIPGATSSSFTTAVTSNDTVYSIVNCTVACATSPTDTSNTIIIYADYLGIGSYAGNLHNINLYPNPNSGVFEFNCTGISGHVANYSIMDVAGRVLFERTAAVINGALSEKIDASGRQLPNGQYLLRVVTGNGVAVKKFTVAN